MTRKEYIDTYYQPSDVSTAQIKREVVQMMKARGYKTSAVHKMKRYQLKAIYLKYKL